MKERLKGTVKGFATCCMERREGSEYDFNDPLLESLIKELEEKKIKKLVLAQLFLSPGRHAGKGETWKKFVPNLLLKLIVPNC